MKHYVTKKSDIGKEGPGIYCLMKGEKCIKQLTVTGTETRVEQSHKDQHDINYLMQSAIRDGLTRHATKWEGQIDDIPVKTFEEAQIVLAKTQQMYDELPAAIRKEFNGPKGLLEFAQNPANVERLKQMGVLKWNDGLDKLGAPSGAPTKTDKDGDGVPDNQPPAEPPAEPTA